MRVRYLTQLNTKARILRFYTPGELIFVMFASLLPFAAEIVIGLDPNILLVFITWGMLTLVIVLMRMGRPEGYMVHFIRHLTTPTDFRPGRVRRGAYKYPVAPPYALRKTPEEILKELEANDEI